MFAVLGLLFGAVANASLLRGVDALDGGRPATDAPPRPGDAHAPPPPSSLPPSTDPWTVLGIAPGAPPREVQRAFRARMAEYHPDKVAALGAELRELAEAKSKSITEAYAALTSR